MLQRNDFSSHERRPAQVSDEDAGRGNGSAAICGLRCAGHKGPGRSRQTSHYKYHIHREILNLQYTRPEDGK